jgi:hypothetical protein
MNTTATDRALTSCRNNLIKASEQANLAMGLTPLGTDQCGQISTLIGLITSCLDHMRLAIPFEGNGESW